MIIAVDFDGTIADMEYPGIGEMKKGADVAIQRWKAEGHYIIIWTCRTGERLKEAINWLLERGIPFDRVNDHCPANVAMYGDGGMKVHADVYIDDQQVGGLPEWSEIENWVRVRGRK